MEADERVTPSPQPPENATTKHDHWFIGEDPAAGDVIRCECGASFGGFIAWSRHLQESPR